MGILSVIHNFFNPSNITLSFALDNFYTYFIFFGILTMKKKIVEEKTEKLELLYDGVYYDVTDWIKKHPGGNIINLYTKTGEDSKLAVQQFHQRSTKKVMSIMKSLPQRIANENDCLGIKMESWKQKKHRQLTSDFLELFEACRNEGLFKCSLGHVFSRIVELLVIFALGFYCIQLQTQNALFGVFGVLVCSLGAARSSWVMHEGGHHSLTGIPKVDRFLRSAVVGLSVGLSGTYWAHQHFRHHAMPQHIKHDVDLKTMPLLAFNKKVVENAKDGKRFIIQYQKWLFVFDTLLVALAWKVFLHPRYCILKQKYEDIFFLIVHYTIVHYFAGWGNYLFITWFTAIIMLGNFTLNHSHLILAEEPTHWVEYSLTHTANIRSSWWVDYWMGNLNYQIEHHLFPTMPQYKNKFCRDKVKALAKKHNLPYMLYWYGEAAKKSFNNLGRVSEELY